MNSTNSKQRRRVVVTGSGVVSPIGNDVATAWKNAVEGVSGIGEITRFDASSFPTRIAGEVRDFDPLVCIEKKELKKLDLFSQFALVAAYQAISQAKLSQDELSHTKAGCIMGIGIGGIATLEHYHKVLLESGPRRLSPFLIPALISNIAPGTIAIKWGLKGVNYVVTSACSSSTHAIGEAFRMIKEGLQDVVITGGAEHGVTPLGIGGFSAMKALSTRNDEPERASRPFDKDRDGFVLSEGAAVLVLEELNYALQRGANILAEVAGYGFSSDAYHITAPCPDGEGAVLCMKNALDDAGILPTEINYINAHGTSTEANDKTETNAIKQLFKEHSYKLVVSSTKSVTGHLLGAAGAIEALLTVYAVKDGIVPPTINLDNPDPECDLNYSPNKATKLNINYALSNSFGFGGTNASLVFKKWGG
ncbi:MAG: beta-ketoacyl-[acyl-carrier-protein] synthase II [Candidatus Dadabacteria bacterium]|nr:MAG: beta-ketoacyl-[acyl-carrier-protein] synthase II [Candidatus Dadabacteria bacterium]